MAVVDMAVRRLVAFAWAGVILVVCDVLAAWRFHHVHMGPRDAAHLLFTVCLADAATVALLALVTAGIDGLARRVAVRGSSVSGALYGLVVAAAVGYAAWALTSGRTMAAHPYRWPAVGAAVLAAFAAGAAMPGVLVRLRRARRGVRLTVAGGLGVGAGACVLLNATLWPRLYPALHGLLSGAAVVAAVGASVLLTRSGKPAGGRGRIVAAGLASALVLALLGVPFADRLLSPPVTANARAWTTAAGRWLDVVPHRAVVVDPVAPRRAGTMVPRRRVRAERMPAGSTSDDLVLLTVDALRADALATYGAAVLDMPALDALAAESVVVERAYTPAPHTSYALTSLLAGTCARTAFEAVERPRFELLPELLGRAGYRTAAFYPSAIFHVDPERFEPLAARHFGFERAVESFDPAPVRLDQAARFLEALGPTEKGFVWAHIFEPHEPYEGDALAPPDASARERYRAELRRTDGAIRTFIARLRKRGRPVTLVLTADHGEEFGDHGGHFHGTSTYDEQIRVPLLFWSSAESPPPPRHVAATMGLADVAPTLLSVRGIPTPRSMTGVDEAATLFHGEPQVPRAVFALAGPGAAVVEGGSKWMVPNLGGAALLFDLRRDPRELEDLSAQEPGRVAALRARFGELRGRVAAAQRPAAAWDEVYARASVGDVAVAPDVIAGLGATEAQRRASAARAAASLGLGEASTVLENLAHRDADEAVRREASLALLVLGQRAAGRDVARALEAAPDEFRGRAAFALAAAGYREAVPALLAIAGDAAREADERRRAIRALAALRDRKAVRALVPLLASDDLRVDTAHALGAIGDRRAVGPLRAALRAERYDAGREALEASLAALGVKP